MKNILFLAVCTLLLASCSKDDSEDNEKYLSEIKITENIYKFGKPSSEDIYERYIYDVKGNLISIYTTKDYVPNYTYYKYDDKNRKIEETNNYYKKRIEYSYNTIDSISEKKVYEESGLSIVYSYIYNEKKQLIRRDENNNAFKDKYYILYSYANNLLIKEDKYEEDNSLFYSYEYEYDKKNNLTKRIGIDSNGKKNIDLIASYKYNDDNTIAEMGINGPYQKNITDIYKYSYNPDKTIKSIHISYTNKSDESERKYYYIYQ